MSLLRGFVRWGRRTVLKVEVVARAWDILGLGEKSWKREITLPIGSYVDGPPRILRYPSPAEERITVGKFCSIAREVTFVLSGNHHAEWVTTSPLPVVLGLSTYEAEKNLITGRGGVTIGNDVWIGRGAMLLSGAVIGDGAVIGARAQVSGRVRPYAIVVGNPAVEIRRRFADEQVDRLLALRWWDLPEETITANIPLLCSPDVETLLNTLEAVDR